MLVNTTYGNIVNTLDCIDVCTHDGSCMSNTVKLSKYYDFSTQEVISLLSVLNDMKLNSTLVYLMHSDYCLAQDERKSVYDKNMI